MTPSKPEPALSARLETGRPSLWTGYPAAIIVIVAAYLLGLAASTRHSQTFDEGAHIVGGYIHWVLGQPRIHTENGYLAQAVAALPLLLTHPHLPSQTSEAFRKGNVFTLGRNFLFHSGNDPNQVLLLGRAAIGCLMAVAAMVVYGWSRLLFSAPAGMFSLLMFVFSPVVLGHGFVTTSDMAVTCFFLVSLAAFWWALQRPTAVRVAVSCLEFPGLLLAKMSGPLIIPVFVALVIIRSLTGPAMFLSGRGVPSRGGRLLVGAGILLVHMAAAWAVVWAVYGFTYSALKDSPAGSGQTLYLPWDSLFEGLGWTGAVLAFARDHHVLPEAFLYGYSFVAQSSRSHMAFANGIYSTSGWWWFFPYVFLVTTPLAVLIAGVMALVRAGRSWKRRLPGCVPEGMYHALPVLLLMGTYWAAALPSSRMATGPRHLLPAYATMCILLGVCAARESTKRGKRWLVFLLPAWVIAESLIFFPNHLSYFNEAVGGPSRGYEWLTDSAVDWGEDLPALNDYLREKNPENLPVYLSYFGTADPRAYGIAARPLPSFLDQPIENDPRAVFPMEPGLYCISASMIQHGQTSVDDPPAPMHRMVATLPMIHLLQYCERHKPLAQAGYSINIYKLSAADLASALKPPPEP